METLPIATVQPGRRLGRAVFSGEGKLLFPPGEVLTSTHLQALDRWGVKSVTLEDTSEKPEQDKPASPPEDLQDLVRQREGGRFKFLDLDDPRVAAIFNLAVERQSRALLSKPGAAMPVDKPSPAFHTPKPGQARMQTLIDASQKLGTLPMVFHRLVEIINSPYASAHDAAKVIATDPALSAKLLRLVNSPFYGLPAKIDTISRAVVLVGTGQIVMLAMGATLITNFKGVPVSLVNMQSFWNHSISCGAAARDLAVSLGQELCESYFVAGLLHDISRLLIFTQLPTHSLYMLTEARRRQECLHVLEKETLGFTHAELGAELLRFWRCPEELATRVLAHHTPLKTSSARIEAILPVANCISQALNYGSSGETHVSDPGGARAWDKLGLTPEELIALCLRLDERIREVRGLLASTI